MVSPGTVLWGQAIIYTIYVLAILVLMAWFSYSITRTGPSKVNPKFFYGFVGFLILVGVAIHITTYLTIPWKNVDLHGAAHPAERSFDIVMENHEFQMPAQVLEVTCDELTEFSVVSNDLTYGFGVFRPDNSMVFQMQVVPWRDDNTIKWTFVDDGLYTVRSTEYSGPEGDQMILKDAIRVTGCEA